MAGMPSEWWSKPAASFAFLPHLQFGFDVPSTFFSCVRTRRFQKCLGRDCFGSQPRGMSATIRGPVYPRFSTDWAWCVHLIGVMGKVVSVVPRITLDARIAHRDDINAGIKLWSSHAKVTASGNCCTFFPSSFIHKMWLSLMSWWLPT